MIPLQESQGRALHFNACLYEPHLEFFITPDAFVQEPFDPQTLDRYAYARNNPLLYTYPGVSRQLKLRPFRY